MASKCEKVAAEVVGNIYSIYVFIIVILEWVDCDCVLDQRLSNCYLLYEACVDGP